MIMVNAYILMQATAGASFEILSAIRKIENVKQAHSILGPLDGIAYVEVTNMDELAEAVISIRAVDGIVSTDTRLAWPF
jgi:DNA-binding Lrp family transcriptional regulator